MKHPLYSIFQEKKKPPPPPSFAPLSESHIIKEIPPSLSYEKVGCIILAGGQGTRLDCKGPKGCTPLPLPEEKTLFELLFEKIKQKGRELPVAVMTSTLNHSATIAYFDKKKRFDLTNLSFFTQKLIPMCDDNGELIYHQGGKQRRRPDGNGRVFHNFFFQEFGKSGRRWAFATSNCSP